MAAASRRTLELFDYVNDLKRLPRTGWLLAGVSTPESIAEHSFSTLFFALAVTSKINKSLKTHGLVTPINRERVLLLCMAHDLAESILTDLPKRSTTVLGQSAKYSAEQRAFEQFEGQLAHEIDLQGLCWEYQQGESAEAKVVHDADKLEMVHQAGRYETVGYRNLEEFWQDHTFHFSASEELYQALANRRKTSQLW